jgi:hypothetical protein
MIIRDPGRKTEVFNTQRSTGRQYVAVISEPESKLRSLDLRVLKQAIEKVKYG